MSLEMLWGEERKCFATVVGLDLVLALSKMRWCSLVRSFKRRLVSPIIKKCTCKGHCSRCQSPKEMCTPLCKCDCPESKILERRAFVRVFATIKHEHSSCDQI